MGKKNNQHEMPYQLSFVLTVPRDAPVAESIAGDIQEAIEHHTVSCSGPVEKGHADETAYFVEFREEGVRQLGTRPLKALLSGMEEDGYRTVPLKVSETHYGIITERFADLVQRGLLEREGAGYRLTESGAFALSAMGRKR